MSRTYRTELKTEPKHHARGKMRTCEMCEAQYASDEMYPVYSDSGVIIGLVCEICSADMELVDGISGTEDDNF